MTVVTELTVTMTIGIYCTTLLYVTNLTEVAQIIVVASEEAAKLYRIRELISIQWYVSAFHKSICSQVLFRHLPSLPIS